MSGDELTEAEIRAAFAEPSDAPGVPAGPPPPGLPRAVDLALAALGLVLLTPLLAVAAIAIRLEGRGPVIYRQARVGRDGEVFEMLKLRTMSVGSDPVGVGTAVGRSDARVTRVGGWLRRLSIDELPNLVNVLRGEMAIVGPRPAIPAHLEYLSERQLRRHSVRPGLTGWAQVNGRADISWGERIELDLAYVARRSPRLDLQILLRTLTGGAAGRGV